MAPPEHRPITLGLRANAGQFALLVGVSALVGGMVGQERAVVPLLGVDVFGLPTATAALSFLIAFGLAKAVTNLLAGRLADRVGRKPVLVAGWLVGVPVPFLLIVAPDWTWVVVANLLLGVNQGLTWSTTVLMKIDLVGPRRRGLALGLNEAAGYLAVALVAFLTGLIAEAAGLRPQTFYLGIAIVGLGLGASVLLVHETHGHALLESRDRSAAATASVPDPGWLQLAWRSTISDPSLSAVSQAGLVNNLNDAMAWGLLPLVWATSGMSLLQIGILAGAYPATWGLLQVGTGALSDRNGRKALIVAGMLLQAAAIAAIAAVDDFVPWLVAAVALGLGTAMVYPTLLAVVADVAEPRHRGAITGVYRFWRDLGFAIGAILVGFLVDRADARAAILAVAVLTALSGLVVAVRLRETRPT
ncbi:MAG: MFS transporter [Chloroflexota bacterium]